MRVFRMMVMAVAMLGLAAPEASAQLRRLPRQVILPPRPQARPQSRARRPEQPVNRVFWSNLQTVSLGTSLDVELKTGELVRGLMESVDDDGLTVRIDSRLETIARDRVDRVSRFQSRAGEGAIRGALSGAAAGFLLSAVAAESSHRVTVWRLKLMGGGAVIGSLGGALGGTTIQERVVVYFSR